MLQTLFSAAFKVRLALWAMELALPRPASLERRFKSGLLGLMAAVAGGVLAALAAGGILIALGLVLARYSELGPIASAAIVAVLTVVLVLVLFNLGRTKLKEAFKVFSTSTTEAVPDQDIAKSLVNGFLSGLMTENEGHIQKGSHAERKPHLNGEDSREAA